LIWPALGWLFVEYIFILQVLGYVIIEESILVFSQLMIAGNFEEDPARLWPLALST
jgi:hypothetical protein